MSTSRKLRIRGIVQGVGFRYALRGQALRLGLSGWVRNRADGSVEALVRGEGQAVESLIAWAHVGPRAARVDSVELIEASADGEAGTGFELLPTK